MRVLRWLAIWRQNDPARPHWHLGPPVVHRDFRRRGIGCHLMKHACSISDAHWGMSHLETDKPINVAFYERLGFVVIRQKDVLGVPNWFMSRLPPRTR